MRIFIILILALFISFGCGGGEQANLNSLTETPKESLSPQSSDPDSQRAGAASFGDITGDADVSILDRSVTDSIGGDSDRVDYYSFILTEEKKVELSLRTVHEQQASTDLILEYADGRVLNSVLETMGVIVLEEILQAGTYYVRIEDDSQDLSIYLFVYEVSDPEDVSVSDPEDVSVSDPDSQRAGATSFGDITGDADVSILDRSVTDSIGGDSDRVDYYSFILTEEKRVELRLRTIHERQTSTDLILEYADGRVLNSVLETMGVIVLEEILQAGTYYVRIEDDSQDLSIYLFAYDVSDPGP